MTDFVVEPSFLVDVLWQTTALLGIGLIGARLARRAARGHVVLLLALMAAVLAPLITASFRALGWGLWDALALPTLTDAVVPPTEMGRAATAGSGLGWAEIVLLGWITVSAIALTRLVTSIVRGQRLLVDSNEADPAFAGAARDVARRLSLSCAPEIRESDHVACPVIWCWGRQPRILLPGGTPAEDARRLTGMLCHELAHWKRGDHRAALATELALCFLPWHPLAWRARARLRELSEHACDDWVLAAGETPAVYAEALLGLVVRPHPALALAAMSTERGFGRRVRRILETHDAGGVRPAPGARWMLLATLADRKSVV